MIKVTDEKGAWAIEADDLMLEILGHEHDKRIRVETKSRWDWDHTEHPMQLRLEIRAAYPAIKRWVNVVKMEEAKKVHQALLQYDALKRAESDLAMVTEYVAALPTLTPRIKAMVEYELSQGRHYHYTEDVFRLETNAEMLVRLRQELELARQKVG